MNTEYEQGTYVRSRHPHNGYYAGDFSDRPFPTTQQLRQLTKMRVRPLSESVGRQGP